MADSIFSDRTVSGSAPAAPSGAPQWLAESNAAPCPACVSERGKVDPACIHCHGTGRSGKPRTDDGKANDERKGNIGRRDWARQPVDHPATEYREMLFGACNTIDRLLDRMQGLEQERDLANAIASRGYKADYEQAAKRAQELENEVARLKKTLFDAGVLP